LVVMKKENTPENGRHGVMKVAPDQAKMSGSLRAIFDTRNARPVEGSAYSGRKVPAAGGRAP